MPHGIWNSSAPRKTQRQQHGPRRIGWLFKGVTIVHPDGYRLVLATSSWP